MLQNCKSHEEQNFFTAHRCSQRKKQQRPIRISQLSLFSDTSVPDCFHFFFFRCCCCLFWWNLLLSFQSDGNWTEWEEKKPLRQRQRRLQWRSAFFCFVCIVIQIKAMSRVWVYIVKCVYVSQCNPVHNFIFSGIHLNRWRKT